MSIPVLFGASVLAALDLVEIPNFTSYLPSLAVGVLVSAVVGFISIHWLLGWLANHSMRVFAWYRIIAGVLCLVFAFWPR
jgi:undecaprenyl-diphosphatase